MANKTACPTCKGKRVQECTVIEPGKPATKVMLDCVVCDGIGTVTPAVKAAIIASRDIWCRCDESSGSHYFPDSAGCKHHWCCDDCNKVTQIG